MDSPLDAIGKEEVELMEKELEEIVVLEVLQALNGEKAPALDNFSIFFFSFASIGRYSMPNLMSFFH